MASDTLPASDVLSDENLVGEIVDQAVKGFHCWIYDTSVPNLQPHTRRLEMGLWHMRLLGRCLGVNRAFAQVCRDRLQSVLDAVEKQQQIELTYLRHDDTTRYNETNRRLRKGDKNPSYLTFLLNCFLRTVQTHEVATQYQWRKIVCNHHLVPAPTTPRQLMARLCKKCVICEGLCCGCRCMPNREDKLADELLVLDNTIVPNTHAAHRNYVLTSHAFIDKDSREVHRTLDCRIYDGYRIHFTLGDSITDPVPEPFNKELNGILISLLCQIGVKPLPEWYAIPPGHTNAASRQHMLSPFDNVKFWMVPSLALHIQRKCMLGTNDMRFPHHFLDWPSRSDDELTRQCEFARIIHRYRTRRRQRDRSIFGQVLKKVIADSILKKTHYLAGILRDPLHYVSFDDYFDRILCQCPHLLTHPDGRELKRNAKNVRHGFNVFYEKRTNGEHPIITWLHEVEVLFDVTANECLGLHDPALDAVTFSDTQHVDAYNRAIKYLSFLVAPGEGIMNELSAIKREPYLYNLEYRTFDYRNRSRLLARAGAYYCTLLLSGVMIGRLTSDSHPGWLTIVFQLLIKGGGNDVRINIAIDNHTLHLLATWFQNRKTADPKFADEWKHSNAFHEDQVESFQLLTLSEWTEKAERVLNAMEHAMNHVVCTHTRVAAVCMIMNAKPMDGHEPPHETHWPLVNDELFHKACPTLMLRMW